MWIISWVLKATRQALGKAKARAIVAEEKVVKASKLEVAAKATAVEAKREVKSLKDRGRGWRCKGLDQKVSGQGFSHGFHRMEEEAPGSKVQGGPGFPLLGQVLGGRGEFFFFFHQYYVVSSIA